MVPRNNRIIIQTIKANIYLFLVYKYLVRVIISIINITQATLNNRYPSVRFGGEYI